MPNHPLSGIHYFFKGFALIIKPGIRRFVLIPLFINIFLFSALIYYGWLQYQTLSDKLTALLQDWLPNWEWLLTLLHWLLLPLIMVTALIVIFFTFTFVANSISGVFNSLLAEAVEKHLTGKAIESPAEPWSNLIIGITWGVIEPLWYYLKWVIVLSILSLIPVVNLISPLLWFWFGAWLVSLEYADAPLANHGYKPPVQRQILAKKRLLTFSFGSTVLAAMLIPGVNLLVMPVAVAGATSMWVHEFAKLAPPHSV